MNHRGMIMVKLALFALTTTMVVSCAHKKKPYEAVPIPQEISPGDTLILLKPLVIADGSNTVYFQRGMVVEKNRVFANAPYCWLEFNRPSQAKQTIRPQNFEVTNVTYDVHAQGKQAYEQVSTTYFTLKAGKTSETDHIACGWPGEMAGPSFLTPEEINAVLDGYFSIEVAN